MFFYSIIELKNPAVSNSYDDHKLLFFTVKVGAGTSIEAEKERSLYNMAYIFNFLLPSRRHFLNGEVEDGSWLLP